MADITTVWDETYGDWVQLGAALQAGDDIVTAVLISIFTDALAAPDDEIPDGSGDPRGWWGDAYSTSPIGSKLWLYERSKKTGQVLAGVRAAIAESVQWLVDDGVAASVDVQCWWVASSGASGFLGCIVTVAQPSGGASKVQFQTAWGGPIA